MNNLKLKLKQQKFNKKITMMDGNKAEIVK